MNIPSEDLDNEPRGSANSMATPGDKRVGPWQAIRGIRRLHMAIGAAGVLLLVVALVGTGLALRPSANTSASPSDNSGCTDDPDLCGPDYQVPGTMVDSVTGQSAFVVAVQDGVTRVRAKQIAQGFSSRRGSSPAVVYIVPQSARWESVHFGAIPNPLTASNLQEVPDPAYADWILTYISVPGTAPLERWGPGSGRLAGLAPDAVRTGSAATGA